MRGGKDEKKQKDPLFPMLHINDADKIGSRAPPRNNMAFCEQVNATTSQRLCSGSESRRTLSSSSSTNLVTSKQVHCHKKNIVFCSSPKSSHMAMRLHSDSSAGMNLNTKYSEVQILSSSNHQSFCATRPLKMTAECTLSRACSFYNSMSSFTTKDANENDVRIPCFGQREKPLNFTSFGFKLQKEKVSFSSSGFSGKSESTVERQGMEMGRNDVKRSEHHRNQNEDGCKVSKMSGDNAEKLHPDRSTAENVLVKTAPNLVARCGSCESGKRAGVPLTCTNICTLSNDIRTSHVTCAQAHQECRNSPTGTAADNNVPNNPEKQLRKRSFASLESLSCSCPSTAENNIPNRVNECPKGGHVSSDDVVELIGPKFFWSVRRTIARQQRIYALQVFELHRLIKVQRLIAASPEMLFEENVISSKHSLDYSPEKKFQLEIFSELPDLFLRPQVDSMKPKPFLDYVSEEAHEMLPSPACESEDLFDASKSLLQPYSGVTAMTLAADAKSGPWCFPTFTGNQWLIPVKSPTEGLIYKPCARPCLPSPGCFAPVYGGCGNLYPTNLDPEHVNFTAYSVPASNQSFGPAPFGRPSCFRPYALPVMNTNSSSAVEQTSPFAAARPSELDNRRVSTFGINYIIPYPSSDSIKGKRNVIVTDSTENLQVSKSCSYFQGSKDGNPDERAQADELSLFPMTPTVQRPQYPIQNNDDEQQIQVIKVVPHNRKSASESAARIFQSIQEERKQQE